MGMELLVGGICTPQGFTVDTFECSLDGLVNHTSVLVADNPCTVAFESPPALQNLPNVTRLQLTKGIAQAIVLDTSSDCTHCYGTHMECVSNQLGLYDENFLLHFTSGDNPPKSETRAFAIHFEVCGVDCTLGILRYGMVVYVTTDVAITHDMIALAIAEVYYRVATGSTLCVMASGLAGNMAITKRNYNFNTFTKALNLAVTNL